MAKLIELEPGVFVAPQLVETDFEEVAARGFKVVVDNRPDGEAADQMPSSVAEAAARRLGLDFIYQPVPNLRVTEDGIVAAFSESLENLPRPVLFYCRSGTRCTILWAQASAERLGTDRIVELAKAGGYDLSGIRHEIDARMTGRKR